LQIDLYHAKLAEGEDLTLQIDLGINLQGTYIIFLCRVKKRCLSLQVHSKGLKVNAYRAITVAEKLWVWKSLQITSHARNLTGLFRSTGTYRDHFVWGNFQQSAAQDS
jgi:hypothetical protein